MSKNRPILVTGCPRSGTSWVGNVISSSPGVFQLYEPFNPDAPVNLNVPERFYHMTDDTPNALKRELAELIQLGDVSRRFFQLPIGVAQARAAERNPAAHFAVQRLRARKPFLSPHRVCVKDPIGLYAADWLAREHDAVGVVMVRHPCAVISSYLALGWESEMPTLINRALPEGADYLVPKCEAYRRGEIDKLDALILQWQILTEETLALHKRNPEWLFIVHDRLCEAPEIWFEFIFRALDLPFDHKTRAKVTAESSSKNKVDPRQHVQHSHTRDSKSLATAWRARLDSDVADQILAQATGTWERALAAFPERPGVAA